jgi:hypothetical protein
MTNFPLIMFLCLLLLFTDEMADVNILVSPLPTGYSKDIHGSITVRPRPLTPMKVTTD